jgi:hypothetical protein
VKKNLDDPGMSASKSFISYLSEEIISAIDMLGVSLGSDITQSVRYIKKLEDDILGQESKCEQIWDTSRCSRAEEEMSDYDSDFSLDHQGWRTRSPPCHCASPASRGSGASL